MRTGIKRLSTFALVAMILLGLAVPVSAAIQAQILPPSPYTVNTNQAYTLSVGVQYNIPDQIDKQYGPYQFWIESPPSRSSAMVLHYSGTVAFSLPLRAPPTAGVYTLGLKLYAQAKGQQAALMDTATVTYQVIEPVKTDWDVEKVWIEPRSPGVGDQVTFHGTVALRSTTSKQALTVDVACYLDKKLIWSGSLTFQPKPGTQDVQVPKAWAATEGMHTLVFAVDISQKHNDPTPLPQYNFREFSFRVEPFYAIIQSITPTPPVVQEGEWFEVVVTVEYRFSGSASLRVRHLNNVTIPTADDATLDTVTDSGSRDYTFRARAGYGDGLRVWGLQGTGTVEFDRGDGWQHTDPGWLKNYWMNVTAQEYYAVFDSITAEYLGAAGEGPNASARISITLNVRYLLPLESGLRIAVIRSGASGEENRTMGWAIMVWSDESTITQEEIAERTATYTYEYSSPRGAMDGAVNFQATIHYLAYGGWNYGDQESAEVSVPYTLPPSSAGDYFMAALQRIVEWFKALFGLD
jgi:hypothetical protein